MRYFGYITLIIIAITSFSCSSDEPVSSEETTNIHDEFNRWVFHQMNNQYLWREDLPDSLDCDYRLTPRQFFKSLLSPRDRFSYFTSNPSYSGTQSADYHQNLGFEYQEVQDMNGNKWLYVLYVHDKKLKQSGICRGDLLKETSKNVFRKAKIVNGRIQDLLPSKIYTASRTNTINTNSTVLFDTIYQIGNKSIGYLCYLEFSEINDLLKPLKKFASAGIDELILDLRYNPGGYVATSRYLCNCIVPDKFYGSIYQIFSYNDRLAKKYLAEQGSEYTYSYFSDAPVEGEEMTGSRMIIPQKIDRLIVITSSHTASASEATILCLRPYMDVIIVGETTTGKGVGSWRISDSRFIDAIQPITMRYYNSLMETTPDTGIVPNYYVKDGYSVGAKDIGSLDEPLLNVALSVATSQGPINTQSRGHNSSPEPKLTPIGEPSFVTEFNRKSMSN